MRTVFKYPVSEPALVPSDFTPVHVGRQGTEVYIWAEVNTSQHMKLVRLYTFSTGWAIPSNLHYIGTVIQDPYVWHIYWGEE